MYGCGRCRSRCPSIKSAGMYAIGVGDAKILSQADEVIPSLTAFPIGEAYKAIS